MKQSGLIGTNGPVTFKCLNCGMYEDIPRDVVRFLDDSDIEYDSQSAPQFTCDKCGGAMYPKYYKNQFGYEFKISDVELS